MGQFKPMVKMETTEPSVILKLKKGGSASFKRMIAEGSKEGFKPVKKMDGGVMEGLSRTPTPTTPMGNPSAVRAMAAKRPMRAPVPPSRGTPMVGRPGPAMPAPMGRPMMKKGGEVETPSQHKAEMKAIKGVGKELKQHEGKPASKAHKGLKTGGVVDGQAGFKKGGAAKKHFATGGAVNSGRAVAMPKKAPSQPVAISQLAGTFKKGGAVEC
jgi:hypothetical protein